MTVHEAIAARRKEIGMTQEDLAQRIESSKTAVSRLEKGEAKISVDRLIEIAAALHTTPAAFMQDSAPADDSLTNEEAGMLILWRQLDSEAKERIYKHIELELKRITAMQAIDAGMAALEKWEEAQHGTV